MDYKVDLAEIIMPKLYKSNFNLGNSKSPTHTNAIENKIVLDLLPDFSESYLTDYRKNHSFNEFLQAFINPKISSYLKESFEKENLIFESIKYLIFNHNKTFKKFCVCICCHKDYICLALCITNLLSICKNQFLEICSCD